MIDDRDREQKFPCGVSFKSVKDGGMRDASPAGKMVACGCVGSPQLAVCAETETQMRSTLSLSLSLSLFPLSLPLDLSIYINILSI